MLVIMENVYYDDTKKLAEMLLKPNDFYRFYSKDVYPMIKDEDFTEMYSEMGRPAVNPALLAHCLILASCKNMSDRDMADAVRLNIGVKYALHLPLSDEGFHFDDLSAFRERLLQNEGGKLLLQKVLNTLVKLGLVKPHKQRTDSTWIVARGRKMKRYETVGYAIKEAVEAIMGAKQDEGSKIDDLAFHHWEKYRRIKGGYKESEERMNARLREVIKDAIDLLRESASYPELMGLEELKLLREIVEQQTDSAETADNSGGANSVQSSEEEKDDNNKENNQVNENTQRQQNTTDLGGSSDVKRGERYQPEEEYVDAGHPTGRNMYVAEQHGINLEGVLHEPNKKVFGSEQFKIDESNKKANCPAGKTSKRCSEYFDKTEGYNVREYEFNRQECRACSLKSQCTKRDRRVLHTSEYHRYILEGRKRSKDKEYVSRVTKLRAPIEGTIANFIYGRRRSRYFRLPKVGLSNEIRACAVNVKKFINFLMKFEQEDKPDQSKMVLAMIT